MTGDEALAMNGDPEETFCYLNQEQTKEYVYPGDGTEDYTVYVTNAAG